MLLYDQLPDKHRNLVDVVGPKMDVSNVAEYYYQHEKEFWRMDDFPWPKPPFDGMWVEYKYPREVYSSLRGRTAVAPYAQGKVPYFGGFVSKKGFQRVADTSLFPNKGILHATEASKIPGRKPSGMTEVRDVDAPGEYGLYGGMWYVDREGITTPDGLNLAMRFDLGADGKISKFYFPPNMGDTDDVRATKAIFFHPILMAFSFSNCKNIEIVDVKPQIKLNKARVRRGNRPLVSYKIINVLPFGKTYAARTRTVESDGQGVALHIRSGNFARYGEAYGRKKLFGKYEGMFWRPQAVVGSAEVGVSVHDYAAKAKED